MKKTRFMSKLFSDADYQEKINAKIDEAHENGSASLEEDGENLQFADVEGDIIVEDKTDGMSEVTRISPNPDDDNDFIVTAVDVPAEFSDEEPEVTTKENVEEKVVTESDNLASIEISRIPGPDGNADDIVDDLEIEVETGINDEEKSGTNTYSLKFKNYSKKRAQMFAKIFSHCADCFDEVVKSANVDEDVQVKFEDGKMKVMSVTFGTPARTFSDGEETPTEGSETPDDEPNTDLTEIIDSANKLSEMADAGITKENADEVKTLAEEIINKAEAAENDEVSLMCIKNMCGKFSEEAAAVADAADETVEDDIETKVESNANSEKGPFHVGTKYEDERLISWESGTFKTRKEAEDKVKEIKSKSYKGGAPKCYIKSDEQYKAYEESHAGEGRYSNANPQVKQCEETGKWFIEEDPEKKLYDTQEEAEQVAARMFSDPKVTVTIEDLEPASVGSLLGYENKSEGEPKEEELAPKVDPNEGGTGRQFSMTAPKQSINPLLYTEIN